MTALPHDKTGRDDASTRVDDAGSSSSSKSAAQPAPRKRRVSPRRLARQSALQALYQWQMTGQSAREVCAQFQAEERHAGLDDELFEALVRGVARDTDDLDALLEPLLDRPAGQIDPIERAILRLGAYELDRSPDVPWRVVMNEAIDLAHTFGAEQSHRFINGILDPLARRLRPEESARKR